LGELSPGPRADWLVLAEDAWLESVGDDALLNRWLFAGRREQIRDVWVAGRAVVEAGRHAEEESCAAAFRQAMAALR
ncbi:MAG TPA: formimidoylglutamate deiminase, partial [Pantoea sp.]|nr:formimidoylglutamate deiminase [Pantoea sp.]